MNGRLRTQRHSSPPNGPIDIRFVSRWSGLLGAGFVLTTLAGCGTSTAPAGNPGVDASSTAQAAAVLPGPPAQTSFPAAPPSVNSRETTDLADALFDDATTTPAETISPAVSLSDPADKSLKLRANLSPTRLAEFLKLSDIEMQNIASGKAGIFDQAMANQEMVRIGKLKLQAATQLLASQEADPSQKILAIRGQLQSLSHLAALGDLKSAEALEKLASEQVESSDATVAEDSRLVLIGLGLEKIQNGSMKDASEVMNQVQKLGEGDRVPNIAAMMVMGQARAVLEKYGFADESTVVRDRIVDLFVSHPDPNVASMALQIAGTPRFADVDRLMRQRELGESVSVDAWKTSVDALLAESPDLSAVQFLASAALQNEAAGRDEWVAATYETLAASTQLGAREKQEVQLAITAYEARQSMIGQSLDLDLPSTDGRPLSLSSYAGKVVLMPFWSIDYPESLSILQLLDDIRARAGDKVEIVGVNLDRADAPFDDFLEQSPVPFRSYHSVSTPGMKVVNKTAEQFGIVSMPFVVIVGTDGKVAAMDFSGQKLGETVDRLLSETTP